jgi:probable phosphoglycerate mutase
LRLFFIRHGESVANVLNIISNRGFQHPLTALGEQQANELAAALQQAGITHLYSSPLMRAVQTAEILGAAWGLTPTVNDALREYDCGVYEGTASEDAWRLFWEVRNAWDTGDLNARLDGGESYLDIRARFVPFIESLIAVAGNTEARIALVGHAGTFRAMVAEVLTNITIEFVKPRKLPNAAYILAERRADRLVCLQWAGEPVSAP